MNLVVLVAKTFLRDVGLRRGTPEGRGCVAWSNLSRGLEGPGMESIGSGCLGGGSIHHTSA